MDNASKVLLKSIMIQVDLPIETETLFFNTIYQFFYAYLFIFYIKIFQKYF